MNRNAIGVAADHCHADLEQFSGDLFLQAVGSGRQRHRVDLGDVDGGQVFEQLGDLPVRSPPLSGEGGPVARLAQRTAMPAVGAGSGREAFVIGGQEVALASCFTLTPYG